MNLTTLEGRNAAINALNESVIEELRNVGVELEETAVAELSENALFIFRSNAENSIDHVLLYMYPEDIRLLLSSGRAFNPTSDPAQYWRTIHAASLLKNWSAVVEAVSAHCQKYRELMDRIREENK
jgi:hypothetical protein